MPASVSMGTVLLLFCPEQSVNMFHLNRSNMCVMCNVVCNTCCSSVCQRGFKLREKLAHSYIGQPLPDSIHLLPSTPQIKGLHTFIRNKDTPRDEFIFYSKRLIRLVIEYALSLLPFKVSWCTSFKVMDAVGKFVDTVAQCMRETGIFLLYDQ